MGNSEEKGLTEDEMIQALRELTMLRRQGVDDTFMSSLRKALTPDKQKITWEEINQKEHELEERLSKWWVIWNATNNSYGIIPREDEDGV